jgi:small neutral amino acid transporter SnatA (MarC family)
MMAGLGPLLASLAAMDVAAFTRRLRRNAILYALVLLFLLTAYGLLVAALAVYLAGIWGTSMALLAVAGGALVLAFAVYLGVVIANGAEQRRKRDAAASNSSKALMMTAALTALPLLVKSRPLLLAAVVGGLGFLAVRTMGTSNRRYSEPAE